MNRWQQFYHRSGWDNVVSVADSNGDPGAPWDGGVKNYVYDVDSMAWVAETQPTGGAGGDASAANQVTGNASLASIDTKTPALASGRVPVDGSGVTQPVSAVSLPLPTSASQEHTAAASPHAARLSDGSAFYKATTPSDTQPVSIAAAVPTKSPVNVTGSGSAAAATVSTVATLTAPANAVGFVLMNLDTSTTNMRWAVGRTASATLGQQLQPGRDSGFIPVGANVSVCAESGTCTLDIQWVSQ